ncbi:uncharacterized protein FA14DRAFT_161306 [Meira miltonrushii]|uniref:CHCH domain-containing protein n=1 Tax=Meira miltonrushii TaxID=1280837 RepID=A0A316V7I1_9BASI|nr:uncharacterized protein FA14DRAFT_161306 [Meira miltonrushii]PWN33476.1 hypothetical protein FA14DRAFT_161306 [Meira miltonrushii]
MKIDKLRVRPKKAAIPAPCAAEFATMLACWASSNDLGSSGECQKHAVALQTCLRTQGGSKRVPKSAINYHLARFSKQV